MILGADDLIECVTRLREADRPFALATVVRTQGLTSAKAGAKAVVDGVGAVMGWIGGGCAEGAVRKAALQALADGKSRLIRVRPKGGAEAPGDVEDFESACLSGGTLEVFIEPVLSRPALIVLGASPVARCLADLAVRIGFSVTVAAPPADLEGNVGAGRRLEGFDLSALPRASSSFLAVATQGKGDREALEAALRAGPRYIAFVSSRRKAAKLKEYFLDRGIEPRRLNAIRAPAGIDIGAATAEEIALSILAEIVRERRVGIASEAKEPALARRSVERVAAGAVAGCCEGDD